jgi:hypothetical protein
VYGVADQTMAVNESVEEEEKRREKESRRSKLSQVILIERGGFWYKVKVIETRESESLKTGVGSLPCSAIRWMGQIVVVGLWRGWLCAN